MCVASASSAPAADTLAAMEQARRCVAAQKEEAVLACREALRLGLSPRRAGIVRGVLAVELVKLRRWEEAVDVYREQVRANPADPEAHFRLGTALLYLVNNPAEAVASLQACLHLSPGHAPAYGALGVALSVMEQHPEAVAAFAEAERLEPAYFEGRPVARMIYEASQRGQRWP